MAEPPAAALGLLLAEDLIFTSRITGTAHDLGLIVKAARTVAALEALARQQPPSCVLVDLAHPGLNVAEFLARLRAACPVMPRVVAYGSHVDAAGLRAARQAGCDLVLPRSKFVEELPRALPEWLQPRSTDGMKPAGDTEPGPSEQVSDPQKSHKESPLS